MFISEYEHKVEIVKEACENVSLICKDFRAYCDTVNELEKFKEIISKQSYDIIKGSLRVSMNTSLASFNKEHGYLIDCSISIQDAFESKALEISERLK